MSQRTPEYFAASNRRYKKRMYREPGKFMCACGRKAYRVSANAPVCKECDEIESWCLKKAKQREREKLFELCESP